MIKQILFACLPSTKFIKYLQNNIFELTKDGIGKYILLIALFILFSKITFIGIMHKKSSTAILFFSVMMGSFVDVLDFFNGSYENNKQIFKVGSEQIYNFIKTIVFKLEKVIIVFILVLSLVFGYFFHLALFLSKIVLSLYISRFTFTIVSEKIKRVLNLESIFINIFIGAIIFAVSFYLIRSIANYVFIAIFSFFGSFYIVDSLRIFFNSDSLDLTSKIIVENGEVKFDFNAFAVILVFSFFFIGIVTQVLYSKIYK